MPTGRISRKPGRLSVFEKQAKRGLTTIDPGKVLNLAYARSADIFKNEGIGEQLYFSPLDGSRILFLDDLKTAKPVLAGHQYCILESSQGNYQHFYVASRTISNDERGQMQKQLSAEYGGDPDATSGCQPHRVPGSVNYKPGRGLFVTRLVSCSAVGGTVLAVPESTVTGGADGGGCRLLNEPRSSSKPGQKSQSEADWAWCMKHWHQGQDHLIRELRATSVARGKHADYSRITVESVAKFKQARI
jgi:RepB DNA-primase from phage plasmid